MKNLFSAGLLLLLSTGPLLAERLALPADSLAANYFVSNDFSPDGFPANLISRDFSIPLSDGRLMVVYPEGMNDRAQEWARSFAQRTGHEVAFRSSHEVRDQDLESNHLILLGSINDNPHIYELYKRRYAFSDAYFPGTGGHVIHPSRSVWNPQNSVMVIGTSRTEDLDQVFEVFLSRIEPGSGQIGAIRTLKTELDFPQAPQSVQPILDRALDNAYTSMAPYGTIANWGLSYHLSGDERWAEHFRDAFYMMYERGERTGRWISESWTNVYFNLWKLMMAWEQIDDDPFFTEEDRRVVEQVLWGFTTFVRWLPNLDPDQAPPGEMRQNHTTFLALSLYFSHRYYTRKYDLDGLEPMMEKVRLAFEDGQANSFVPNDDAGGYLKYGAHHTLIYLMAENDMRYIDQGHLERATDLLVAVYDNQGQQVTFGDVGGYSFRTETSIRDPELQFFSMAASYYDNPEYRWFYDWIGLEEQKRFNLTSLYNGEYVRPMQAGTPERFTGVQVVDLDEPTRKWFGRRAWREDRIPRSDQRYFHKIAMRQNFEAEDEYLLLGGLSALSHGHHDGNTILRLTWKDRIWLFDLDYIKMHMKYHNGVTVVRDGVQEDPPGLTRLDVVADSDRFAITRSTAENYNGADWGRTILWNKGEWFLVLDDLKAVESGDFRFIGRWRTRGDEVRLEGNRLTAEQGGKSFRILSADIASRHLEFEADGFRNNWSAYPYGEDGLDILVSRKSLTMERGDVWRFSSLMTASDDLTDSGYELLQAGENRYLVTGPGSAVLVGMDPAHLESFGLYTDAALYLIDEQTIRLVGLSQLKGSWGALSGDELSDGVVMDHSSGVIGDFQGNRLAGRNRALASALREVPNALHRASSVASRVHPEIKQPMYESFGIEHRARTAIEEEITVSMQHESIGLVTGDGSGRIRVMHDGRVHRTIQTPSGAPISALAAGDVNGNGRSELVAGDREGNLYAYGSDGQMIWHHELTPFFGTDASVNDITIGQIDDSGRPVVLAGNSGWKVTAVDADGGIRWESFVFYHMITKVGILERGDGQRYVVAGNAYHSPVNVINPETGVVMWYTWEEMGSEFITTTDYFGMHLTQMAFLDADGDGMKDVVFGTLSNEVHALQVEDGTGIWSVNAGGEVTVLQPYETTAGSTRILVGNDVGGLMLLSPGGEVLARSDLMDGVTGVALLPPGEGPAGIRRDLAVSTASGSVVVFDEELLIRAVHYVDQPLQALFFNGQNENVYRMAAVGPDAVIWLDYEFFNLKRSMHY